MCGDESANSDSGRLPETEVPLAPLPLHSTNLLTVLDRDGIVQYESPSIEEIYGYEQAELVGEQVAEYFHPDDRERVTGAFEAVVASDEYTVEAVEYRHRQADGTYLWVESVASANPTPDGNYVINTRDISERKQYEARLERQNRRLDEFAGVVSHDLRNPLTVAIGRLELIADDCESEHVEAVERAHHRMETLIEELLLLARQGDRVSGTDVVDLGEFVRTCWDQLDTAGARVVTDIDARIEANATRLQQLFENLVRNAIDHGGRDVTVSVGTLDDGFYVADDGAGIPLEDREQVFEAGYSTAPDGTGFGLGIVEQVVAAHGWEIRLSEAAGGGARFEVTAVEFGE